MFLIFFLFFFFFFVFFFFFFFFLFRDYVVCSVYTSVRGARCLSAYLRVG